MPQFQSVPERINIYECALRLNRGFVQEECHKFNKGSGMLACCCDPCFKYLVDRSNKIMHYYCQKKTVIFHNVNLKLDQISSYSAVKVSQ